MILQPDESGDNYRWLFYGKLKPGYEYESLKSWSESGATSSDFGDSDFLTLYGDEKIFGLIVINAGSFLVPVQIPLLCGSIPTKDAATDGELIRCALYDYVPTEGEDLDTLQSEVASWDETIGFYTAHNWGDEPFAASFSDLASGVSDSDGDYVPNAIDNCPDVGNYEQSDANLDGVGDACETAEVDTDGDGIPDASDECKEEVGTAENFGCPAAAEADTGVPSTGPALGPVGASEEKGGACSLMAR